MAIETKTFPYEILIRFSSGEEHQTSKVGDLEGAHYIERTRMFDTETGEIVGTPKGQESDRPQVLPADKISELLGSRFVEFEEQVRRLQASNKDAMEKAEDLARQLAEKDHALATVTADHDAAKERLKGITALLQ